MDKKQKFFAGVLLCTVSMGIGTGGMYLANKKKIDFMNKYPAMLEAQDFAENELLITPPDDPEKGTVYQAYFTLYGDKYTTWTPGDDSTDKKWVVESANELPTMQGSGIRLGFNREDKPCFTWVDPDGAAAEQGIETGDIIVSIDGKPMEEYKNIKRLNGKDGETVQLVLDRNGEEVTIDFVRCADEQAWQGVTAEMYGDTLYIGIESMGEYTAQVVKDTLAAQDFGKIIFDLRNNGGGMTSVSLEIADLFLSRGTLYEEDNEGNVTENHMDEAVEYDVPAIVLVNGSTASASEIFTALMRNDGGAKVIGMQTFGKAIYQVKTIFNGGVLKYTEGKVYVDDLPYYHGVGLETDIIVDMPPEYIGTDKDIQLQTALEEFGEIYKK